MNTVHARNCRYKNGEYNPHVSAIMAREKATSIEPTKKQVKFRDDLHKFCLQKGVVGEGFRISRTKQGISANIRAFISVLKKNGLLDEFFAVEVDNG